MKKQKKTKNSTKNVAVTRDFLLKLADDIYNPKTKRFLRLCNGKLKNGPDPTDESRLMHCGLGELYFAMTGRQPFSTINEEFVIDLAVKLSPLGDMYEHAAKDIMSLDLPLSLKEAIISSLDGYECREAFEDVTSDFRCALNEIPNINDDCIADHVCSDADYRNRARRVAAQFRSAAKCLPK